jgi:hypothetical protein
MYCIVGLEADILGGMAFGAIVIKFILSSFGVGITGKAGILHGQATSWLSPKLPIKKGAHDERLFIIIHKRKEIKLPLA